MQAGSPLRLDTIAIGTACVVLPLRDRIAGAKQALSVDQLTEGRFILGLSTGDRPSGYPSFGATFSNRAERFRDAHQIITAVANQTFPGHQSDFYGSLDGSLDMIPKARQTRLKTIAVGRCGQDISWLAQNMDGWIWHQSNVDLLPNVIEAWRSACGQGVFNPYGYGTFFELDSDANAPLRIRHGIHGGRKALIELWKRQRDQGVSHVALNMRVSARSVKETIDELAEFVLPLFV